MNRIGFWESLLTLDAALAMETGQMND